MIPKRGACVFINGNVSYRCLILGLCFSFVFCSKDATNPRLTLTQDDNRLLYNTSCNHTVLFKQDASNKLFVGGTNVLLQIDIDSGDVLKNFTLNPNLPEPYGAACKYVVTVIQEFENSTFVCGTNGGKPMCWKLYSEENNRSSEVLDGTGISPHAYTQNSISLVADGDLYTAAPLYSDGTLLQFRRKAGKRISLWMHDQWVSEPTFISSFLAKREDDPTDEKIYVLFREKNSDTSPEADPWISRVARVCKVDEGGPKQVLQNIWTSFLKARLVCGIPSESLYFNRLQDIFVVHADDWRDSRVYALFSSSWNATAVCIYSLEELNGVFETSSFKGYEKDIPSPRPGTCVNNSRSLPVPTLMLIKDHPEMKDWVQPIHKEEPFFTSTENFTKIAVDRVEAANGSVYSVLLLATANGVILKILEDDSKAFIISETHLYKGSAPVQAMKLDSEKKKLFVGYPGQISVLDLQRCQDYGTSCQDCVLSRDPYCAWTKHGCTSETKGGIQNIADGQTHVCDGKSRFRRDLQELSTTPSEIQRSVPLKVAFYLSCPISSHHANYWWEQGDKHRDCQQIQSECLLLIPVMTDEGYGTYMCKSEERDYTKTVRQYFLSKPVFNAAFKPTVLEWIKATFVTVVLYLCGV